MKVVCIHHRLGGYSSHHFNEANGFNQEFARRRWPFVLLVSRTAVPTVAKELRARAVLDDPTFRMEWSFEERSRRFVEMLHTHVDRRVTAGDCLLITIATQLEAHALVEWIRERPQRKRPWVVVLFLSDRWNRHGSDEHARQMCEFDALRLAISKLSIEEANRLIFLAVTEGLANELSTLMGTTVGLAPMPLPYAPSPARPLHSSRPPRVGILGGTRREKGSYLIPDIVRECSTRVDVEFLVHLTNNTLTSEELGELASITTQPNVIAISDALNVDAYNAAIAGIDIALFPYEEIPYRQRTSGVFAEAVAFGKPVIATARTWMADQIERGHAAGIVVDEFRAAAFAEAIARCAADLEPLTRKAMTLADAWRRTVSLPAFVDVMESQIAKRAAAERPRRTLFGW